MNKNKSKKKERTRRVNLCLSESVYKWLCKIATGRNIMHGSKQSVGRLISRQLESDYNESLIAGKANQNLKPVVYEKRPWAAITKADAKRKTPVSRPLNGKKTLKKEKKGA